jgi:hypothetical protein
VREIERGPSLLAHSLLSPACPCLSCFESVERCATQTITMRRVDRLPITALVLVVALPLAWFACGGGSKPPESPEQSSASESSSASGSAASASSDTPASAASASASAEAPSAPATPSPEPAAASAPPPPSLGTTDCGKCIDKACSKEAAACGKNSDCQVTLEGIHSCSSGAAACIESGTPPSAAKPKKLATAYQACGKKAVASKACKAKCQ